MAKTTWLIAGTVFLGVFGLWFSNSQAHQKAEAAKQAELDGRQARVTQLARATNARDGWQDRFEDRQVLSADVERAMTDQRLIIYGSVADVRTLNGQLVIVFDSALDERTLKLELVADEAEVAVVGQQEASELSRLLSGSAVAASISAVSTVDVPDGQGDIETISVARGELLGIVPYDRRIISSRPKERHDG